MWGRFTEAARRVVFYAQQEAGYVNDSFISAEHLLMGLLRADQTEEASQNAARVHPARDSGTPRHVAAQILVTMGVSLESLRSATRNSLKPGLGNASKDMQLTPRGKRVIDLAYDHSRQFQDSYIGTEHLLLGLIAESSDAALWSDAGITLEKVRRQVQSLKDYRPTTVRAERLIQTAKEEAAVRHDSLLSLADLWTGLLGDEQIVLLLSRMDVSAEEARKIAGGPRVWPPPPRTEAARLLVKPAEVVADRDLKRAVDFAHQEAKAIGHKYLGPEHLLIGTLRAETEDIRQRLSELGLTVEAARRQPEFSGRKKGAPAQTQLGGWIRAGWPFAKRAKPNSP